MVRRHRVEGRPVTAVAAASSVSRQAFYEAAAAFETGRLPGLLVGHHGLVNLPECGMGYQRVDLRPSDGRELKDIVVFNAEEADVPDE